MKKITLLSLLLVLSASLSAQTLYQEDFETNTNGSNYFTGTPEQTDGFGDFFTRTDGSTIGSFYEVTGQNNSFYFAAQDIDADGGTNPNTLTTASIDVSGQTDITFSILLAEDDDSTSEDWDTTDYVHITYSIDGGADQNLIWIEANSTTITSTNGTSNGKPFTDPNFDGDGIDGVEITSAFNSFSESIALSGASNITFKIEFSLDSGDEDIAIDNISVDVGTVLSNPQISVLKTQTELYPNPSLAGADVTLQTPIASEVEVSIYNSLGAFVRTQTAINSQTVSTEGLAPGAYFVQLTVGKDTTTKRLIIE